MEMFSIEFKKSKKDFYVKLLRKSMEGEFLNISIYIHLS